VVGDRAHRASAANNGTGGTCSCPCRGSTRPAGGEEKPWPQAEPPRTGGDRVAGAHAGGCRSLCCPAGVPMMEAADHGRLDDATPVGALHLPWLWRVLAQGEVGSGTVVQVGNQTPIGSSREKSGIRGTRGTAVPCGLIGLSSGVGGRCSSADLSRARSRDRSKCRNGCSTRPAATGCAWGRSPP
jgi:hypothetical protein